MRMRTVLLALVALVATALPLSLTDPAEADGLRFHGSVNQVYVIGATPGSTLTLRHDGTQVATGTADARGPSSSASSTAPPTTCPRRTGRRRPR